MVKYTMSKPDADVSTVFLERNGSSLTCPYYNHPKVKDASGEASCGDWCPLFDLQDLKDTRVAYLLCGSGNAAYTIES